MTRFPVPAMGHVFLFSNSDWFITLLYIRCDGLRGYADLRFTTILVKRLKC